MNQIMYWYWFQEQQKNSIRLGNALAEAYISGLELVNTYGLIYRRAFEGMVEEKSRVLENDTSDDSLSSGRLVTKLYEKWIELADKELQKELKSEEFLSLLSKYTGSFIDLHAAYRTAGFPVEYFDLFLDSFKQTLRIPLSILRDFKLARHDVVHKKGKVRLLHYHQDIDKTENNQSLVSKPLLIVYAPINQFHILDLNSKRSVVRNLLSNGLDVYLLDWGFPGLEDSRSTLNDYIDRVDQAVQTIKQQGRTEKVSILGYCWGGMFALIYTALNNDSVRSLALMATPVDFNKDSNILGAWSKAINTDSMMDEFRQMDGQLLDIIFMMRNPPRYAFDKYLTFLRRLQDTEFVSTFIDTESWLYDTPPVPGNLYRQIMNDCYKNNLLASNRMKLDGGRGQEIDLGKVTVPLLTIIAERDDIITKQSALAVDDCVSTKDKATLSNPGGHVALCISNEAHKKLWPDVARWILSK